MKKQNNNSNYNNNNTKREKNITGKDKETEYFIVKCQKWLFSQNNSTDIYNDSNSVTCNVDKTKRRRHPYRCKKNALKEQIKIP